MSFKPATKPELTPVQWVTTGFSPCPVPLNSTWDVRALAYISIHNEDPKQRELGLQISHSKKAADPKILDGRESASHLLLRPVYLSVWNKDNLEGLGRAPDVN